MPKPPSRIEPGAGLKNWKSNPATARRVTRLDGPPHPMFGGAYQQEHTSGRVDGRVGGTFVDAETETRYRKGLIVVAGITPITLADLEQAFAKAKAKFRANPADRKAKQAYREVGKQLSDARRAVRASDPRRLRAHAESRG
jgi:hypothetical protein